MVMARIVDEELLDLVAGKTVEDHDWVAHCAFTELADYRGLATSPPAGVCEDCDCDCDCEDDDDGSPITESVLRMVELVEDVTGSDIITHEEMVAVLELVTTSLGTPYFL